MTLHEFCEEQEIGLFVQSDPVNGMSFARLEGVGVKDSEGLIVYHLGRGQTSDEAIRDLTRKVSGRVLVQRPLNDRREIQAPVWDERDKFYFILKGSSVCHEVVNINITSYTPVLTTRDGDRWEFYTYSSNYPEIEYITAALKDILANNPKQAKLIEKEKVA